MNNAAPLIIEAAINGATPKDRNPNVPRTVDEIVESAIACLEAGAAIVHNPNDDPIVGGVSGRHASEPYVVAWRRILERYPDALLYPTYAGGGPHTHARERYAHVDELRLAVDHLKLTSDVETPAVHVEAHPPEASEFSQAQANAGGNCI